MSDLIDRQSAIEALKNDMASLDHIIKGMSANDVRLDVYVSQRNQVNYDIYTINNLPPAPPEYLAEQAGILVTDADTISRQAAIDYFVINVGFHDEDGYPIEDTDELRKIWTEYFDGIPPAQPERIKGHWIESNGLNILMKKFIEKGETWRVCDKCGAGFMIGYQYECDKLYHETFHNFCPKCGAEMEVTE